jgi:hypothetical protein
MSCWAVTVTPHTVTGPVVSYEIPAMAFQIGGDSSRSARRSATQHVHIVHGLPGWRPYLRQTWPHVTVTPDDAVEKAKRRQRPAKAKA